MAVCAVRVTLLGGEGRPTDLQGLAGQASTLVRFTVPALRRRVVTTAVASRVAGLAQRRRNKR